MLAEGFCITRKFMVAVMVADVLTVASGVALATEGDLGDAPFDPEATYSEPTEEAVGSSGGVDLSYEAACDTGDDGGFNAKNVSAAGVISGEVASGSAGSNEDAVGAETLVKSDDGHAETSQAESESDDAKGVNRAHAISVNGERATGGARAGHPTTSSEFVNSRRIFSLDMKTACSTWP